jgi:outer membrane protein assembly factor BamB
MSRAVPAVTDEHVVAMGPKCHVICLDAAAGTLRWSLDLAREYGAEVPQWYAGQCPLVELGAAVLAPSGACLMMAVECATGRTLWQTPNPRAWKMTHTSIAPMELDGRRTYVYAASGGVAGVAADDGRLLWDTEIWRVKIAAIATPVVVPPDRVFLSGGYNVGAMMIRIVLRGDAYVAEEVFSLTPKVFGAEQSTPVYHDGHIYGVRPNGELVCLDLDGRVVWTSGHEVRFGKGLEPYIVVGDTLLVMSDAQVLTAVEAAPGGYRSLGSHRVLDGHDSWGPMAVAGGRLIVRDLVTMKCIDLEAK